MEVRLLYENEIQWAASVATEVYNRHVLPYGQTQMDAEYFMQYVKEEHLMQELQSGRLFMWGVFEQGQLCAVSAMQNVGHITMLYVVPYCQRRGYASILLKEMRIYASSVLGLNRITINAFPKGVAPFFTKRGFRQIPGIPSEGSFLPLECRLSADGKNPAADDMRVTYTTRKVSNKVILGLTAGVLVLLSAIGVIYTLCHLLAV